MLAHPLTIENDLLKLEVRPSIGGKVSSLLDKRDKFELLFNFPTDFPTSPQYDRPFADSWCAGWDECFPAIAPGPYVGHPYNAINIPDHGELWGIPTSSTPSKHGMTTIWHGIRFGYRLTRTLTLEGPELGAEYVLENLAPFEFHFVWAQHALMSLASPVELSLPDTTYRLSHDAKGNEIQKPFTLSDAGELAQLRRPLDLPANHGWKIYATTPIAEPVVVRYPGRNHGLEFAFSSTDAIDAFWGIWINTGGWAGHHHFAIEPTTGRFDQLDRAVRDRSNGSLPALGKLTWSTRWTLI